MQNLKSVLIRYDPNDPPVLSDLVNTYSPRKDLDIKVVAVKKGQTGIETTLVPSGETLQGDLYSARFLARLSPNSKLDGEDALQSSQIDQWISLASVLSEAKGVPKDVNALLQNANNHLALRTFLVEPNVTIADLAVWLALQKNGKANPASLKVLNQLSNVNRWFLYLNKLPAVKEITAKYFPSKEAPKKVVAKEPKKKDELSLGHLGGYLKLENVDDSTKVVTRFPPEPSGYLHIGHAKAVCLNHYYAQKYNGTLLIRFDDTNPRKEKDEYIENILNDLKTLEIPGGDKVTYTSDYIPQIQEFAIKLLKEGNAYIDDTPVDEIRTARMEGLTTPARDNTPEKNLALFQEMLEGTEHGQKCILRAKIETEHGPMKSPNKALRDPALYRVIPGADHPRQKDKYKAYPLYDLACPIVDSLEGVTHALRTNEYHDRNNLYYWVLEKCGLRKVYIEDYSRLNFSYSVMSKRKLQRIVDLNKVSGWTDPSFPTVQGLIRRGLTVVALRAFVISQGASKSVNMMDMDKLWAINRKVIDPIVARHTAVTMESTIIRLSNGPSDSTLKSFPRHKKNDSLGEKSVSFSSEIIIDRADGNQIAEGEEVTLMDWGNCICKTLHRDENGQVTSIDAELHLEGSVKTTSKKLTWLDNKSNKVKLLLKDYANLITEPKVPPEGNFDDYISPQIEFLTEAYGDLNLRDLPHGTSIQLERKGYFRCDKAFTDDGVAIELVKIPEGKKKDMSGTSAR